MIIISPFMFITWLSYNIYSWFLHFPTNTVYKFFSIKNFLTVTTAVLTISIFSEFTSLDVYLLGYE